MRTPANVVLRSTGAKKLLKRPGDLVVTANVGECFGEDVLFESEVSHRSHVELESAGFIAGINLYTGDKPPVHTDCPFPLDPGDFLSL